MTRACSVFAVLLLTGLLASACGGEQGPPDTQPVANKDAGGGRAGTPSAAIRGMLALAEAGKWDEYVSTYYGERQKMTKPDEQIPQVAARMKKIGPQLIQMLGECVDKEPRLNAHGTVATYPNQMKLYLDHGAWGFHL